MSDLLQDTSAMAQSTLKFSKIHSPKMKSVYWRYFGFPTGDDNCIITKQNVVCVLCHKVLVNHGNTTNLRAHLQYRHKDIFQQIIAENGISVPPRKLPIKSPIPSLGNIKHKRELLEKKQHKVKIEFNESEMSMVENPLSNDANSINGNEEQDVLYEHVIPMTYDDDDNIDNNQFTKIEVSVPSDIKTETNRKEQRFLHNSSISSSRQIVSHEFLDSYQLQDSLINLLVTDMMNVESLYCSGMSQFIRTLCAGSYNIPSKQKIETHIKEMHSDKYTTLSDQIKVHSQIKPYSLGFEYWTNVEDKHFLSIYFNYISDAIPCNLVNQLYCTIEHNKFTAIDLIFDEFNLQNCTAVVVNVDDDDNLKQFLETKNIPILVSYDAIVNQCIKNVISLPAVSTVLEEIKDTLLRYNLDFSSKEVEIPTTNENFPLTYYELVKFFSDTISWPEDVETLVNLSKTIYEILNTLSVTLDTLKGEEIPLSSMLSPITSKVLTKKLLVSETDDDFTSIIKTTIASNLEDSVLNKTQLTICALLDPRFHRLMPIKDFDRCVNILTEKYNAISESQGLTSISMIPKKPVISTKAASNIAKKSNLELFFDITETSVQPIVQFDTSVETDLKRYRTEVYASLDENPFVWWSKIGNLYGSLKHLAAQYQCVPCVVNMMFKKSIKEQILEHQKRFMLSGNLIDAILFLHYNK